MPRNEKSYNKWIEAAYFLFGELGPDNMCVKGLSEVSGLSRTNFYYHFADKEQLIEQVLKVHIDSFAVYKTLLKEEMNVFIPDFHTVNVNYKQGFKFHWQLFRNRSNINYNHIYTSLNKNCNTCLIPKIKEFYQLDVHPSVVEALWETVTDTWYSRLDFEDFNIESLNKLTNELMNTVLKFSLHKHLVKTIQ